MTISTGCIILVCAFIYLLFRLKLHGRYMLCAAIAIAIPILAIIASICVTGGIFYSPSSALLVLQPLVAYFFAGVRGGYITTAICATLIIGLVVLQNAGVEFLQLIDLQYLGVVWILELVVGFFVISTMAFVFEFTAASLRKERDAEHVRVVNLANTDSLTGLANRRVFDEVLYTRVDACKQDVGKHQFALCYLDLDGFKPVNDQHGHEVGDQVLRAVSIRLRSALRGADLIGRQGGDEFMLLLDELGANRALEVLAQRFITLIKQPIETSAGLVSVGASLGFAVYPQHAASIDLLKKAADTAMYAAKRNRAGWLLYTPAMVDDQDKGAAPT